MIGHAAVPVKKVRESFEVFENPVVVGVVGERVRDVDPDWIFLGHYSVPKSTRFDATTAAPPLQRSVAPFARGVACVAGH
jgi:hypothetical protein